MYLLIPQDATSSSLLEHNLHPNMYLLILKLENKPYFKFLNLHPNMYLLIPALRYFLLMRSTNLHPNMYLLIQQPNLPIIFLLSTFTSQHVSINSGPFNLTQTAGELFTSQHVSINSHEYGWNSTHVRNLHPNMYLLILVVVKSCVSVLLPFTSQHVSINSLSDL